MSVWCYYENSPENRKNYGKLYNYYAVQDLRGLAPNGFHIPKENEWNILIATLEGKEKAGTLLKTEND